MKEYLERRILKWIEKSVKEFELDISGKVVLTEGATGNYAATPIIASLGGAKKVFAFTKDSEHGSSEDAEKEVYELAKLSGVEKKIEVVRSLEDVPFSEVDILTNTGFLRPIDRGLIGKLSPKCVIPLMYEPWEFKTRRNEIDLEACYEKGIKVYGTNEGDGRVRTLDYLAFTILHILLADKISPIDTKVLLIGCRRFVEPVFDVLKSTGYKLKAILNYDFHLSEVEVKSYDAIVILEHERDKTIIGGGEESFLHKDMVGEDTLVIHVCGKVDFEEVKFRYIPEKIKPFGYMSIRADFVFPEALIKLHTAGLKVAEGMIKANELGLKGEEYKKFMESNYPALAFDNPKFW